MFFLSFLIPDVINQSDLSIEANEFVPTAPVADVDFEPVQSLGIIETEPYTLNQSQNEVHEPFIQDQQISATNEQLIDTNPSLLKFDELSLNENILTTEQQQQPEIETLIAQQPTEPEPELQPQPEPVVESNVSEPVVAAAAIAATTAAVAAAAVGVAKAAASSKPKPSETKKTDVKGKVAPIKKPTAPITTTSKLAAKPSTTTATKTTTAPRVASRTVTSAPKVGGVAEKKTTTTSTVTRKPLSNGSE